MLTLEQVKNRLNDRRCSVVADAVGMSTRTVERVRKGYGCSAKTLEKLSKYFEEKEAGK